VSKAVARLVALGVVAREADGGRNGRAALTPAGTAKAEAIAAIWDEVEAELTEGLDRKDRRRLRKGLRRAARNLAPDAAAADAG
jgi:DNA-binding MarR family transcriptional regulator